jgi:hypothetical protein
LPTNPLFNKFDEPSEQKLYDDLFIEMIQISGLDLYYMPRTHVNIDYLFVQDPLSKFKDAIAIEMLIKNFMGWEGPGDLMTKFGITMADRIDLCVSKTRFFEDLGITYNLERPMEGDLIYIPMTKALFEIKFVEHEAIFYQTGTIKHFELHCERFIYNSEEMETGIPDIDAIESNYTESTTNWHILTQEGQFLCTGQGQRLLLADFDIEYQVTDAQNETIQQEANTFVLWSESNPFSENL